ncbi:ABC transporter substrate-binding protein [Pelagibius litoralis]|uniref:ABC transporter substrate-binding protein n=1 Tax=Pelagibius litoralis TaxID=374515 RepID=A0A967F1N6_9PROT|nr:ABC transporter substrate-binding protein [Pelagibius litoralis]NIA71516.1 ABC transporter substrate-binding protein [Pelagibius litoralis]
MGDNVKSKLSSKLPRVSRRSVLKSAAVGATAIGAGPLMFNIAKAADEPIRIGFPVPLTGPYGSEAQEQARCAQIAVDQFNAAGGLNGRMAELLVRDDKLKPGEAATRTLELIEKDKVHFVCGSLSASVQLSVNAVTKARGIIYVSISQSDAINEAKDFSKYTFHEAMNPHMTAGAVGRYAFPKFGKRVAFLIADYAYGHEMVRGFKRAGEAHGIEVVAEVTHPLASKDFSPFLPQIQAARPDVLCLCNFGYDQMNSLKQATGFGLKQQMQMLAPALLYNQRRAGGAAAYEGVIGGTNYHWTLENSVASAKAFNDVYRKENKGAPPSDYGAYGYAGVGALLDGVMKAGTTDSDPVIAALEALKYDKYKGTQYYRKCDHQSVQSVFIIKSKSKKDMANEYDVFDIVHTDEASETVLRSCADLGHEA